MARLEWRIDEFEKLMKLHRNGANVVSQQFWCGEAPDCRWELHIYPNGKREEDAGHVSFFLRQVGLVDQQAHAEPILTEFQVTFPFLSYNCRVQRDDSRCRSTASTATRSA